ncbi:MAG: pyridoxamine 5'-phosphate oxidase family protein [Hyphomicrobiales bacterium]|nr:pyridoxamine 5'-phosphate oxidase family protein [Hyphomicrobiales bacterium]
MIETPSDVAFSAAVKAEQTRRGSRRDHEARDLVRPWPNEVTPPLADLLARTTSFFFATASAAGRPHVQHRGGPPGFLAPLDEKTLAFADYGGNRQYVTVGNLSENPYASIFLMEWATRTRVKLWGRARVAEDDPTLFARVDTGAHAGPVERVILFEIDAWDRNCRRHIPMLVDGEAAAAEIRRLEAECARLAAELAARGGEASP